MILDVFLEGYRSADVENHVDATAADCFIPQKVHVADTCWHKMISAMKTSDVFFFWLVVTGTWQHGCYFSISYMGYI